MLDELVLLTVSIEEGVVVVFKAVVKGKFGDLEPGE